MLHFFPISSLHFAWQTFHLIALTLRYNHLAAYNIYVAYIVVVLYRSKKKIKIILKNAQWLFYCLPCTFAIILPGSSSMYPSPSNLIAYVTHHFVRSIVIRSLLFGLLYHNTHDTRIVCYFLIRSSLRCIMLADTISHTRTVHFFFVRSFVRFAIYHFAISFMLSVNRYLPGVSTVSIVHWDLYVFWWYLYGDWIEQNVLALKYIMSHMSGDLWLFD